MNKTSKILLRIMEFIVLIYVISFTSLMLFRNKYGFTQFYNKTFICIDKSMGKTVKNAKVGDLVVVKSGKKFKKNDIIYYYTIHDESFIVGSGKIKIVSKDSSTYTIENDIVVYSDRILGKKSITVSKLGSVINYLESKTGFLIFVLFPIIIIFTIELACFFSVIKNSSTKE